MRAFCVHTSRRAPCQGLVGNIGLLTLLQHEDCEHTYVLGSSQNDLPLQYTFDGGLGASLNANGTEVVAARTEGEPRGQGGSSREQVEHAVSVYLDEKLVGVATTGHFNLTDLEAGWHTLQIVVRDAAGNDLRDARSTDTAIFSVSNVKIASMDLPAPELLGRERRGHIFSIALVVVATGRYIHHVRAFAESALLHFCRPHNVTVLVLSDASLHLPQHLHDSVRWLGIPAEKWPFPTLKKPHFTLLHWDIIGSFDFAFVADVDLLFVRPVGIEVHVELLFVRGGGSVVADHRRHT